MIGCYTPQAIQTRRIQHKRIRSFRKYWPLLFSFYGRPQVDACYPLSASLQQYHEAGHNQLRWICIGARKGREILVSIFPLAFEDVNELPRGAFMLFITSKVSEDFFQRSLRLRI